MISRKTVSNGYMWYNSEDAKNHALEECFVRGNSIGISSMSKQGKAQYLFSPEMNLSI
jgi:hypothetical protein